MIFDTWKNYFTDPQEGLGTIYERFILNQIFMKLQRDFKIQEVLEAPSFGMTGISGINSLWWAKNGAGVTVIDDNKQRLSMIQRVWSKVACTADFFYHEDWSSLPLENNAVDLSWNFAALWWINDFGPVLRELARIARKAVLICVPNKNGLGLWARRAFDKESVAKLKIDYIDPIRIKSAFSQLGWELETRVFSMSLRGRTLP